MRLLAALALATVVSPGNSPVVLGSRSFGVPGESGWGTAHPDVIYNGGDPSGYVWKIRWKNWGAPIATGRGLTYRFRPLGGYYKKAVNIELRASSIGRCSPSGPRAYRRLVVRANVRPGGRFSAWYAWGGSSQVCVRR
jgi:hypothetical protein